MGGFELRARYLSRIRPGSLALSVTVLTVTVLTPLCAWAEEPPGDAVATLDNPWLVSAPELPAAVGPAAACDPWQAAVPCAAELSDPWASDPSTSEVPLDPASAPSEPVAAPVSPPPDVRFLLRGEDLRLEVGVDWVPPEGQSTCLPETAAVQVRGVVAGVRVSAHHVLQVSALDGWVIDLGAPETPYE